MNLPINLITKTLTIEQLKTVHKFEEVLAYCEQCNNFKTNYSCPDLAFNPLEYLEQFEFATLILTEVKTDKIKAHIEEFGETDLESQVQKLHMPKNEATTYNIADALAMKCFNHVKDIMSDELLALEKVIDQGISSPPGSCTRCAKCTKVLGEDCRYPEQLRYSLEALGFLISQLYNEYFDLELEWSAGEIPLAYHSCSAIFHHDKNQGSLIHELLLKSVKSITI